MKKYGIIAAAVLLLPMLFSGCNSETDSELDKLIENLPAAQISDGKINFDPPASESESTAYSSVTGNVISVSSKEITVKYNDKEYKFTIDGDTKIYGGEIQALKAVTITYEGELSENKIIAGIITILTEDGSDDTEIVTSEEPPVTANTEAETEPIETTVSETTTASETTTVSETTTAAETTEEALTEAVTVQTNATSVTAEETAATGETASTAETEALPMPETTTA